MRKSGQISFNITGLVLSSKRIHFPSTIWICCCMQNKLCDLIVTFVMIILYQLLYYKEYPAIYWMTLVALLIASSLNKKKVSQSLKIGAK